MQYTHPCVKCKQQYQSEDPDPFYCSPCDAQRKTIAATVDAQFKFVGESNSLLKDFEQNADRNLKTPDGRTVTLMNANKFL